MNNRDWINKMCIYDFLLHLNIPDPNMCIVSRCKKSEVLERCRNYIKCDNWKIPNHCIYYRCGMHCLDFKPDCDNCIMDYLREER